ncbi:hypothetical protein [Bacillus sp. NPDC094106]|uniref:hypothetical protein n=1 Tax=Bacillus sp. NPDC094106 TaxID=3363949 RepID=UPI003823296E
MLKEKIKEELIRYCKEGVYKKGFNEAFQDELIKNADKIADILINDELQIDMNHLQDEIEDAIRVYILLR